MNAERFWKILDGLPQGAERERVLRERLSRLAPDELVDFQKLLDAAKCSRIHMAALESGERPRKRLFGRFGF